HDIFKTLQVFAVLENREVRADGRTGSQHPQGVAVRDFVQHKETCRFAHNLNIIARFQCGKARAEFAVRDGDQIELKVRIIRRVDVRVGALHALPIDIQTQLGELPGGKWMNGSVKGGTK